MNSSFTRRSFLKVLGTTSVLLPAFRCSNNSHKKPSILLIECDSMDGRVMGCMGHPASYTPNLDKLAQNGILFKNAYCNSPQCVPSRSSMFSGKYTQNCQGWNNYKGLEKDEPTFLSVLEQHGYLTKTFGKTDWLSGGHSLGARVFSWTRSANLSLAQKQKPVAYLNDNNEKRRHEKDWRTVDFCKKWLQQNFNSEKPFLLYCGITQPHPEFRTSKYWLEKIDPANVTLPPKEKDVHPVMQYMQDTKNCNHNFSDQEILEIRRTYYAMIAEVDAMVGELVNELETLGLLDSTIIIFTSDHGEMNMEHSQYLKNALYEASVRVPLIVAGPKVQNSISYEGLVSLVDIYPTLMDLTNCTQFDEADGHSFYGILIGKKFSRPDWVFCQYHSNFQNTGSFMLRQGNWKYIAYPGYEPQLFNLQNDPHEIKNLAKSNPEIVTKMDKQLREIVDYEIVDESVKKYDKQSFQAWMEQVGEDKVMETLAALYKDKWNLKAKNKILNWAKGV